MMFGQFETGAGGWRPMIPAPGRTESLGVTDRRLLWALRRLALMQPIGAARCHAVHVALQQDFGDSGLGVEHLLRCLLVGLSRRADRQLVFGQPACPLLLPDEVALIAILHADDADAEAALTALAGPRAAALLPLVQGLHAIHKIYLVASC